VDSEQVATAAPVLSIPAGSIRIDFLGRASITAQYGADSALLVSIRAKPLFSSI